MVKYSVEPTSGNATTNTINMTFSARVRLPPKMSKTATVDKAIANQPSNVHIIDNLSNGNLKKE